MSLLTERPRRRTVRRARHGFVEVTRIVRKRPDEWSTEVEYSHGSAVWSERLTFVRRTHGKDAFIVRVTDADYPTDRAMEVVVKRDAEMTAFIVNFLVAGRW